MKKNWPYILLFAAVIFILWKVSRDRERRHVDWSPDYTLSSKKPFGCYVLRDYLGEMMKQDVNVTRGTVYQTLKENDYEHTNYVFINNTFEPSAQDVMQLCKYAANGNNVLISAMNFGLLTDTLNIYTGDPVYFAIMQDSVQTVGGVMAAGNKSPEANLVNPALHLGKNAVFDHSTSAASFAKYDTAHAYVLGKDGLGYTNFIRIPFGKGAFFIHTMPDAFGNYYAANPNTSDYLVNMLSYLPSQKTFIDAHYKFGRREDDDTRRYIFSEPALKLGYMVLIIAGLIGLFLGGKRRQRPVPVVTAPSNSTLEFVEQVGALYYNKGDHTNIAGKKINYFLESIRSRFYMQTNRMDEAFLLKVESLSGCTKEEVKQLFNVIDYIRQAPVVSSKELQKLEELIRSFNSKSKR